MQQLVTYSWPGNVRELRNVIQQISLFAMGTITPQDIPPEINGENPISVMTKACQRCLTNDHMSLHEVVDCLEVNLIKQALQESEGNKSNAAKKLGVNFSTFRDKLRKFGLE
jgi:two-component system response regulator PilR (NtrC family)